MGEKIALGFHTCVDYELIWDLAAVEKAIIDYDIHDAELVINTQPETERDLWTSSLAHLKAGIGGEIMPTDNQICLDFANRFQYNITLGGTSTRAALAIEKIGYSSVLQMCCYNEHVKRLLPAAVQHYSSVGEDHTDSYPHISLSYNGNVHIQGNDIDFVTSRENRVLISRDVDSLNMIIKDEFSSMTQDAEVFLMSCFSQVLDEDILRARLKTTQSLIKKLPEDTLVVAEDGCYVEKEFRFLVHKELAPYTDIISMNEDELQEYIGKKIDILDAGAVLDAVKYVYERIGIKTLIVHSAAWALAYGEKAQMIEPALEGAIIMAATRFQHGDDYGIEKYNATKTLSDKADAVVFSKAIESQAGDQMCCIPCKDLSFVTNPTVVGLGDSFIGGLLPGLLKENRK